MERRRNRRLADHTWMVMCEISVCSPLGATVSAGTGPHQKTQYAIFPTRHRCRGKRGSKAPLSRELEFPRASIRRCYPPPQKSDRLEKTGRETRFFAYQSPKATKREGQKRRKMPTLVPEMSGATRGKLLEPHVNPSADAPIGWAFWHWRGRVRSEVELELHANPNTRISEW